MDADVPGQAECVCTIQYGSLVVTKRGGASGCRCSRQAECVYSL